MSHWKTVLASALILSTSTAAVLADCSSIPDDARSDGAWLFRTEGGWRPVSELTSRVTDGRTRRVAFAYVASEPALGDGRRGILVIKTGIDGPRARTSGLITLARQDFKHLRPDERCESYPRFKSGSIVRIRSYDLYHDYSYRADAADEATLDAFHVTYPARKSGCKASNNADPDSWWAFRSRSNRSDFSFDRDVVKKGQHSQFASQFSIAPAYAETRAERHVVIKRYAADQTGLACVLFRAVLKPGSYIRVNDLERRTGLFRADEQSWEWPTDSKEAAAMVR